MLFGRIFRDGRWWGAECHVLAAFTQGRTRSDARMMLAAWVTDMLERPEVPIAVTETARIGDGSYRVLLTSTPAAVLVGYAVRRWRERHEIRPPMPRRAPACPCRRWKRWSAATRGRSIETYARLVATAPELVLAVVPRSGRVGRR
jgi:hypothetical protein